MNQSNQSINQSFNHSLVLVVVVLIRSIALDVLFLRCVRRRRRATTTVDDFRDVSRARATRAPSVAVAVAVCRSIDRSIAID